MVSCRAAGIIILSLVFGALVNREADGGYRAVLLIVALAMLIPLYWAARVREPGERNVTRQIVA